MSEIILIKSTTYSGYLELYIYNEINCNWNLHYILESNALSLMNYLQKERYELGYNLFDIEGYEKYLVKEEILKSLSVEEE